MTKQAEIRFIGGPQHGKVLKTLASLHTALVIQRYRTLSGHYEVTHKSPGGLKIEVTWRANDAALGSVAGSWSAYKPQSTAHVAADPSGVADGIAILVHQYRKLDAAMRNGDFSDATFGTTADEARMQLVTRRDTLGHALDMLNVNIESFTRQEVTQ